MDIFAHQTVPVLGLLRSYTIDQSPTRYTRVVPLKSCFTVASPRRRYIWYVCYVPRPGMSDSLEMWTIFHL